MAQASERFRGKVAQVGNSKGVRLDAAFFRMHPEFSGDVDATIVGEGHVLLSVKHPRRARKADEDPVMLSFLGFLEREMAAHPEDIRPLIESEIAEIGKLVKDVDPY